MGGQQVTTASLNGCPNDVDYAYQYHLSHLKSQVFQAEQVCFAVMGVSSLECLRPRTRRKTARQVSYWRSKVTMLRLDVQELGIRLSEDE